MVKRTISLSETGQTSLSELLLLADMTEVSKFCLLTKFNMVINLINAHYINFDLVLYYRDHTSFFMH